MRKITLIVFMISFLSIGILIAIIFPIQIRAGNIDGWIKSSYCDPAKGFSFKAARELGMMMIPYSNKPATVLEDKYPDKCVLNDTVGAFHDLSAPMVVMCEAGYGVGRRSSAPNTYTEYYSVGQIRTTLGICCPIGYPISNDKKNLSIQDNPWSRYRCCKTPNNEEGDKDCPTGEDPKGVPPVEAVLKNINDSNYFFTAEDHYSCPMEDCLMQGVNGSLYPASEKRDELSRDQIDDPAKPKICVVSDDTNPIDGSNPFRYCIQGEVLSITEYADWSEQLTEFVACKGFTNQTEKTACLACLKGHLSRVYSSLGCIDTEMNALIIRIFQIGIGIVGAIGVFRIMQAAILRQSADPAKIQESWDIITSVIIGLVVLLGSIIILRVIGINVLGILPLDF